MAEDWVRILLFAIGGILLVIVPWYFEKKARRKK